MGEINKEQVLSLLKRLGFIADEYYLDRYFIPQEFFSNLNQLGEVIQVVELVVSVANDGIKLVSGKFEIDGGRFGERISDELREKYSSFRNFDWIQSPLKNFYCLQEFALPDLSDALYECFEVGQIKQSHGLAGLSVDIQLFDGSLAIGLANHFSLGSIPKGVLTEFHLLVTKALGSSFEKSMSGAFEQYYHLGRLCIDQLSDIAAARELNQYWAIQDPSPCEISWDGPTACISFGPDSTSSFTSDIPFEIMEQREGHSSIKDLEALILEGRFIEARSQCLEKIREGSPLIFRRLALLESDQEKTEVEYAICLESEPSNLLYLSLAAKQDGGHELVLERISRIGEILENLIEDFGDLETSEIVLAETLGDLWALKDMKNALPCYERCLDLRGPILRLLVKKAYIAKVLGYGSTEVEALKTALDVITSPFLLAAVNFRLSLIHEHDPNESILFARAALQYDRGNVEIGNFLSDILLNESRPLQAIQVLDGILDYQHKQSIGLKNADIALLELKIGKIWVEVLDRSDLASKRFDRILALDDLEFEIYQDLLDYFKGTSDENRIVRTLERMFYLGLHRLKLESVDVALHQLMERARNGSVGTGNMSRWLSSYLEAFQSIPEGMDEFLSTDLPSFDWQTAFDQIARGLSEDDLDAVHHYDVLARIARQKLGQVGKAVELYMIMNRLSLLNGEQFSFVCSSLERSQKYTELIEVMRDRIQHVAIEEKIHLLKRISSFSFAITEDQIESQAIEILKLDQSDDIELKKIITRYEAEGKNEGIWKVLHKILSEFEDIDVLEYWLNFGCKALEGSRDENVEKLLNDLYQRWIKITVDRSEILVRAIANLKRRGSLQILTPYVRAMVLSGSLPELTVDQIEELLASHRYELALANRLLYLSDGPLPRKIAFARKACHQFRELGNQKKLELEAIHFLGRISLFEGSDIERLWKLCTTSQEWHECYDTLKFQFNLQNIASEKLKLARRILQIRDFVDIPDDEFLSLYSFIISNDENPEECIFELAEYAMSNIPVDDILPYVGPCFDDYDTWKFPMRMTEIIRWLCQNLEDPGIIKRKVRVKTKGFLIKDKELFLAYENILSELDLSDRELAWEALRIYCYRRDFDQCLTTWYRRASLLTNVEEARVFIIESKELFRESRQEEFYERILNYGMTSGFPRDLALGVEPEFKIEFALDKFNRGEQNDDILKIIEQHFDVFPNDSRAWLPLYFLYRERGHIGILCGFLRVLVPMLKRGPDVLKDFPITIETLEKELNDYDRGRGIEGLHSSDHASEPHDKLEGKESSQSSKSDKDYELNLPGEWQEADVGYSDQNLHGGSKQEFPAIPSVANAGELTPIKITDTNVLASVRHSGIRVQEVPEGIFFASHPQIVREILHSQRGYQFKKSSIGITVDDRGIDDAILGQFSVIQHSSMFDKDLDKLVSDWKGAVRSGSYTPGMTQKIMNTAFERRLEKHVAIQCFALLSGEIDSLDSWSPKVWRDPSSSNYSFDAQSRMNRKHRHPLISGTLHKILSLLSPIMIRVYQDRFSIPHIAKRAGISPQELIDARMPLPWSDIYFVDIGIARFKDQLVEEGFTVFSLGGLGSKLYFDYGNRALYFDGAFYKGKSMSFIFHRILVVLRAVTLGFYPVLKLNPTRHIVPFLREVNEVLRTRGDKGIAAAVRNAILKPENPLKDELKTVNKARLLGLYSRLGELSENRITDLQRVLWTELYKLQLAESLDVIGLIESIVGQDFVETSPKPKEILRLSKFVRPLLEQATNLELDFLQDQDP